MLFAWVILDMMNINAELQMIATLSRKLVVVDVKHLFAGFLVGVPIQ